MKHGILFGVVAFALLILAFVGDVSFYEMFHSNKD